MADPTIAILEALARRSRASRAELVLATGLSGATVGRTVDRLRRDGIVREHPVDAAGVGRPPRVVELDPDRACVVGIDAGGRTLRAAVGDLGGTIRARLARPIRDPTDAAQLVDDLVDLVVDLGKHVRPGAIQAAAAGISGIVDHRDGRVLLSPDLPGLAGLDLAAALEDRLGLPVAIDNDDLLAAIGEASVGAAIGCRDVVFLSLGFGLGAGIIVDGRPVRGIAHAAGAVAYLAPGRLEDRASGRAIPIRYREALIRAARDGRRRRSRSTDPTGRSTTRGSCSSGPTPATSSRPEVIADVLADLGDLVVDVGALLDPEVIVIGGGLSDAGAAVLVPLERRIQAALPYPPRIVASVLEDAAVLHGAVSMAVALARRRIAGVELPARPGPDVPTLALF